MSAECSWFDDKKPLALVIDMEQDLVVYDFGEEDLEADQPLQLDLVVLGVGECYFDTVADRMLLVPEAQQELVGGRPAAQTVERVHIFEDHAGNAVRTLAETEIAGKQCWLLGSAEWKAVELLDSKSRLFGAHTIRDRDIGSLKLFADTDIVLLMLLVSIYGEIEGQSLPCCPYP